MRVHFVIKTVIRLFVGILLTASLTIQAQNKSGKTDKPADPLVIDAPELNNLNFDLSTGGLPIVPGLETYTVIRSDREHPELAEGLGYTYQHHPDISVWHGRIYVGWNSCEKDEDTWPSRELISWSLNGKEWSKPAEMFPQGVSTPLRMYFFLSPDGRMLIIAGMRTSHEKLSEKKKNALVVRELRPDHTLGEVFTLKAPPEPFTSQPPLFEKSGDRGLIKACRQLLADNIYLQQQDYGNMVEPAKRMKWNDPKSWAGDDQLRKDAENFGKAMCFYKRKDGALVGLSKNRWVTVSYDKGKNWIKPVRPSTFVSGMGKVWGQKTSDGRYLLVYNPHLRNRWPLSLLTSKDGTTFSHPYAIHGDLPQRRYDGAAKDPGASYHRGLSKWNNDGSLKDKAVWMVYSLNKEDIRVIRIPYPIPEK